MTCEHQQLDWVNEEVISEDERIVEMQCEECKLIWKGVLKCQR